MTASVKTIEHLPHFLVSEVNVNEKNTEYFELIGVFDRTDQVTDGRCSLLMPIANGLTALPGYLEFQDQKERTARIYVLSDNQPEVLGQSLAFVPAQWSPRQVWMVVVPTWPWKRSLFQATDAIGEIVKDKSVSLGENEEIEEWVRIREKGSDADRWRFYPVFPSEKHSLQIEADGTIKGGWDHVHCDLCNTHIDSGCYGYLEPNQNWACESCYDRYIANHDLSFMFV